jgi:hypothetical protein
LAAGGIARGAIPPAEMVKCKLQPTTTMLDFQKKHVKAIVQSAQKGEREA